MTADTSVTDRIGDDLEVAGDRDMPAEYSDDEIQERFDNLDAALERDDDV